MTANHTPDPCARCHQCRCANCDMCYCNKAPASIPADLKLAVRALIYDTLRDAT